LNLGKYNKKKQHFEQRAEKIRFLSKTLSRWGSERWSKHRYSRSSPSEPPKLHICFLFMGSIFQTVTLAMLL